MNKTISDSPKQLSIGLRLAKPFWKVMLTIKRFFARAPRFWASVFVAGLVINHGILAETGAKSFEAMIENPFDFAHFSMDQSLIIAGATISFLFMSWQIWGLRERLLRITAHVSKSDGHHAHARLILHLSERRADQKPRRPMSEEAAPPTYKQWEQKRKKAESILSAIQTRVADDHPGPDLWINALDAVCDPKGTVAGWNWQQPLRAILRELRMSKAHPSKRLCDIVVTSSRSSKDDIPLFQELLNPFLKSWPQGPIVLHFDPDPIVDLDVQIIAQHITRLIDAGIEEYPKRRICVDATAGQKPYSIGVALATLNRDMAFVYVTNGGVPHYFDANVGGVEFGGD